MAQADSNNTVIPSEIARRSFVAALAGGAALAASSLRPAAAFPATDAILIAAIDRLTELKKLSVEADAERDRVWEESERRCPAWPAELRWRIGDPVGYERCDEGGKAHARCSIPDIFKLQENPTIIEWRFKGTEAEQEALTDADFGAAQGTWEPKPHIRHLYEPRPDKRHQKRADQIIQAWDKYAAERDAVNEELRVSEIEDHAEELWDQVNAQLGLVIATRAQTLTGHRAKLDLVRSYFWQGTTPGPQDGHAERELVASIMRDVDALGTD
jgi:hypothetical protein